MARPLKFFLTFNRYPKVALLARPISGTSSGSQKARKKRLIVCCDGTGQDAYDDDGMTDGFFGIGKKKLYPTNVVRLARSLKVTADNGISQVVYYQPGVGTTLAERFSGTAFGHGLSRKVRQGYGFLANNYEEGDEIFFFGFSRGSFTARSICGLVCSLGLLTQARDRNGNPRHGMDYFAHVYDKYYKNVKSAQDPAPEREKWKEIMEGMRKDYPFIHPSKLNVVAIGCFDTVGFQKPLLPEDRLELPNVDLPMSVNNAFHALSLDEKRAPFSPALWHINKTIPGSGPNLHQVWFVGDHSDVGGSHANHELANITLAWMVSHCMKVLDFNLDYVIRTCLRVNPDLPKKEKSASWIEGLLHDRYDFPTWRSFISWLPGIGKRLRRPGEYFGSHQPQDEHDQLEAREFFHATVRLRQISATGYKNKPIASWEYHEPKVAGSPGLWTKDAIGRRLCIEETELGPFEKRLRDEKIKAMSRGT